MTRAEIMEMDIHRSERTGVNTQKNVRALQRAHAKRLKELGRERDVATGDIAGAEFLPHELTVVQQWFCESYDNPGAYCVYDDEEHGHQTCLYCHIYEERK